ncbi:hypothetical protein GpartN1_g7462.t1 [Galdieria partita]|uniref:Uncharacterized protein n=1 Tax=Galdieria partita TaxID=83374 RepID=A0A9C7UU64_9RHOD|nr:hypothetical protein GpartN1_g7462.t1 [Galdieria partita]
MVSERKVYVDILEQQSLLKCQASSATWGCCTENAKFSFFSSNLRQNIFLCAKHLTWILEEPEQQVSEKQLKDYETIGKKKAGFLERDPQCTHRPCMAVHAAGRRRGKVCGHVNTFCFYSFLFNNYIYLCRRHFLWIDGQIAHEISFAKVSNCERQDEESTSSSLNFAANLSHDVAFFPTADILLNTSPVTPTRTKADDSMGTTEVSDSHSFLADSDSGIIIKDKDVRNCERVLQKKVNHSEEIRHSNEERNVSNMDVSIEEKTTVAGMRQAKANNIMTELSLPDKEFPLRYNSDTNVALRHGVVQNYANDEFSEDYTFEERSCPASIVQQLSRVEKIRDEGNPSQLQNALKRHVHGKLKSLQLKSENISRLLLHRGRPRSPTIDEHSANSLPTHLHKENVEGNGNRLNKKPSILSIPISSEIKTVGEEEGLDRIILEQSEESSAVSEKEDPSSLNVAARIVLDPHVSESDNVTRIDPEVPYSVNGHDVTLTTQFSETKFSTTEEVRNDNTMAASSTTIPASLERHQHSDSCCCTIC